jgi:hypothetical protein
MASNIWLNRIIGVITPDPKKKAEDEIKRLNAKARGLITSDPRGALLCSETGTDLARKAFGEASQDYAIALADEGFLRYCLGVDGGPLYLKAVHIYAKLQDSVPYFVDPLKTLAATRSVAGKSDEARAILKTVEEICRLFTAGKEPMAPEQAVTEHELAPRPEEEPSGFDYCRRIGAVGMARKRVGDLAGAVEAYQRALCFRPGSSAEEVLLSTILNNLGVVQRLLGEGHKAVGSLGHAAEIRRRVLGDGHSETQATLFNLAEAQAFAGNCAEAAAAFQLWVRQNPKLTDPPARLAERLAANALKSEEHQDAISYTRLSVFLWEQEFSGNGRMLGQALWNGACVIHEAGGTAEARAMLERSLKWLEAYGAKDDVAAINARSMLESWV